MKHFITALSLMLMLVLASVTYAQDEEDTAAAPRTPEAICADATPAEEPASREYTAPPSMVLETGVDYYAVVCTPYGPVYINLFETLAPKTVNNFVFLAESGYYNNLTFHRVMDNFMVQGGDPLGTGSGGPGYQFEDEFVTFMTFDRPGLLAMANAGPNTNGSQFFITTVITDWLTYAHTIFGEVIYGQDNALAIPATEIEPNVSLETIVIITDPASVDVNYGPVADVEREQLAQAAAEFPDVNVLELDAAFSGDFDSADYVALLPEDLQETATTFFEAYNHDYTLALRHQNATCDLTAIPIETLDFQIHVFATPDDARSAITDEAFLVLVNEGGDAESVTMEFSSLAGQVWQPQSSCDVEVEATRIYRQLGRFITVTQAIYPTDAPFDAQVVDGLNIDLYDATFFEEFRAEASR